MPWYNPELDHDFAAMLKQLELPMNPAKRALDLGTGPGTQAIALSKLGYLVTATDISDSAILKAAERARRENLQIDFLVDNILESHLREKFDLIIDRGCFHVLPKDLQSVYVRQVRGLLVEDGLLFLKCFSDLQPGDAGPYRFAPSQLRSEFEGDLNVLKIVRSEFRGKLKPNPQALFMVAKAPKMDNAVDDEFLLK